MNKNIEVVLYLVSEAGRKVSLAVFLFEGMPARRK